MGDTVSRSGGFPPMRDETAHGWGTQASWVGCSPTQAGKARLGWGTRATFYNRVGVVKRHVFFEGLFSPLLEFLFRCSSTKARFQNPAVDLWFHQPSIRSRNFRS